jgi:O-antigen/teichoic acid export membrane protein
VGATSPATNPPPAPPAVPKLALSLTLSSGAVFFAALSIQILGLVASVFLYKNIGIPYSGRVLLGTVQLFLLIGSSINGVGDLRLGTAYTYFLARGKSALDNTATYLVVRMLMVASAGLVIFLIAPLSIGGTSPIAAGNVELTSLGIFAALPILWSFSTVYNQMFIGQGNSLKAQYPGLVEALARLPVLVYVSYHDPTIQGLTLAYVVGATASTLFSLPAVIPELRKFQRSEATRLFHFAWPLMGSLMLNYLVTNMIPLIVNASLGVAELTVFLAANGFRILVLSLPAAVTTPLFPYLAGLHRQERYESLRRSTWQALRYSSMLLVPGVVALVTYRYNFLNDLANASYAMAGAVPLAILVVGAIPLALSQIIQSSINATGRQRLELYITSTQVAVLFGMVFLLLPPFGIFPRSQGLIAGSIAVLASSCAALALNTYFMERLIAVHIHIRSIVGITLSAAGSFGALWFVNRWHIFPVSKWYELLAVVVLGFAVYFVVLALVGELTREDVHRIGHQLGLPSRLVDLVGRACWRLSSPDLPSVDPSSTLALRQPELPETFTGTTELPSVEPLATEPDEETHDPPR